MPRAHTISRVQPRLVVLLLALSACPDAKAPVAPAREPSVPPEVPRADALVTPESVDAWLAWHHAVAELAPPSLDAGRAGLLARARAEAEALRRVGLTPAQLDAVEDVIAAVATERLVARWSGAQALEVFEASAAQLPPERRAKAEAALADLKTRGASDGGSALEARFGADAVRAVLTREAEVTKTWEALLEARGETP
jgi:hypothetical protein